jgi:hypothetical protein
MKITIYGWSTNLKGADDTGSTALDMAVSL